MDEEQQEQLKKAIEIFPKVKEIMEMDISWEQKYQLIAHDNRFIAELRLNFYAPENCDVGTYLRNWFSALKEIYNPNRYDHINENVNALIQELRIQLNSFNQERIERDDYYAQEYRILNDIHSKLVDAASKDFQSLVDYGYID